MPSAQSQVFNMGYDVSQLDNQVETLGSQDGFLVEDLEKEALRDMSGTVKLPN